MIKSGNQPIQNDAFYLTHNAHKQRAIRLWPFIGTWPAKMLVREPPQTNLFGTKCPKEIGCGTAAVAPLPFNVANKSVFLCYVTPIKILILFW